MTSPDSTDDRPTGDRPLRWPHYVASYFAGFWAVNVLPHLLHGIDGRPFPTPFADPPFQGLSSPLVNVLWALSNVVAVYALVRAGRVSPRRPMTVALLFAGFATLAVVMAVVAPSVLPGEGP